MQPTNQGSGVRISPGAPQNKFCKSTGWYRTTVLMQPTTKKIVRLLRDFQQPGHFPGRFSQSASAVHSTACDTGSHAAMPQLVETCRAQFESKMKGNNMTVSNCRAVITRVAGPVPDDASSAMPDHSQRARHPRCRDPEFSCRIRPPASKTTGAVRRCRPIVSHPLSASPAHNRHTPLPHSLPFVTD